MPLCSLFAPRGPPPARFAQYDGGRWTRLSSLQRSVVRSPQNFFQRLEPDAPHRVLGRTGLPYFERRIHGTQVGPPATGGSHRDAPDRTSELEAFLSPEAVFSDPFEIVADPDLGIGEKRAILARWLARICATEAALGLKWMPPTSRELMQFDDVMDALRAVDQDDPTPSGEATLTASRKPQKFVGPIH
jgi:hypothetical protein